ncbi:MAG TPA: PAS domain-containing protein [Marmoricola sp.]|nr:PAS domain-containing protein [Marmoricola sp.]
MDEVRTPLGDEGRAREADARLLFALFDQLPAMIAYWDRDLRNVVANQAYIEWFGFTPEQMRGVHIREVLGEEVYAKNRPHILAALEGQEQLFDRTLVDTFGRTRHTQASYVPDIVGGKVRGFFVLVTDVTPRVEAQQAMDEAQSLARLGSWSWSRKTGEITWSDELYRIFGVDRTTFVPTMDALMERVHPDDAAEMKAVRDQATVEGREYSTHYRICRPDGTVREIHSRGRPTLDADGVTVRLTGTAQDVTEANEAAREMARVNAELRQVNQLNADVLGMLGHDVRSPLTVILGYLEGLDEDWHETSESDRRDQIAVIRSSAAKLRALVDDILALATLDSGNLSPRLADHGLGGLVREALEEVPGAAAIKLHDGGVRARCDAFHVRQIVANLAANAVRYGAAPMTIAVSERDGLARVVVADHGPGVPDDLVPHLFERFSRGSSQLTASSGFGLYIAHRLAEANGGTLSYRPGSDGCGAVFTLTLPTCE